MSLPGRIFGDPSLLEASLGMQTLQDPQLVKDMKTLGMPPEEAAEIILDGVQNDRWRILIGTDTESLDALVRASPDTAYDEDFVERWRKANADLMERKDR